MEKNFKNKISGIDERWGRYVAVTIAFIGALAAYLLTLEPDASYWDCPEYLVTAIRLEVGHPPGNPTWSLTGRIFSFFGMGDPQAMAIAVNASSALFTALGTGMLAAVIYILAGQLIRGFASFHLARNQERKEALWRWGRIAAAVGGALSFGWADSPWFSAVEAEVYAMSLFFTALCVRIMTAWAVQEPGKRNPRLLILIVYLTGLSIGVHQLNLLVIPALAVIWLFARRPEPTGVWRITGAILVSFVAIGLILFGMMPGMIEGASKVEILCVNNWGMPQHSGAWIFWLGMLGIVWLIPILMRRRRRSVQMIAWIPAMLLTGYVSYMILPVRSAAEPPMNEGAPDNVVNLAGYLGRDQYGSTPLFYGRTPRSRMLRKEVIKEDGKPDYSRMATKDGRAHYAYTDSGYVMYDHTLIPIEQPELNMWFPRLTSSNPADISSYGAWAGMTEETMESVDVSYALDSLGNPVGRLLPDGKRVKDKELRPTYLQQLRYMLGYQIGYMYFRYMLWNYAGRQNDRFAVGEVEHGNFITGIPPVDNLMLGNQSEMPEEIGSENSGHNVYFLLPLITGILGIILLQRSGRIGKRANLVILMLYLMTGLAIVFYLNQSPREPRERDYSFLGSMWAWSIWIGSGMLMLISAAIRYYEKHKEKVWGKVAVGLSFAYALGLPAWMLYQNYDDHDRSGRQGVTDYATNLLESLEPNAILFTSGDNFTFPLWWAQEVAGVRRDVRIINTAYLTTNWYVRQLMIDGEGGKALEMTASPNQFAQGEFKFSNYTRTEVEPSRQDTLGAVDAIAALRKFYAEGSDKGKLPGMLRMANPEGGDSLIIRSMAVASGSSWMGLKNLATLDILATNAASEHPRPVYWLNLLSSGDYGGVMPYTQRALHTRKLVYSQQPDAEMMHRLLDNDFEKAKHSLSGRTKGRGDGYIYADDTFGRMISTQRFGLLRLGGRLLQAGRYEDALAVAELIDRQYPADIWEYQIVADVDSSCNEGLDLARLYLESAVGIERQTGKSQKVIYQKGLTLLEREKARLDTWKRYRNSLPPRLRNVMTPKNMRKARYAPEYADSLIRQYGGREDGKVRR